MTTITLFHGTTKHSAEFFLERGWSPGSGVVGGQCGQNRYLYLTNLAENALWYSQEKGDDIVLTVEVPLEALRVDPEDGVHDTVEEELAATERFGTPGNVVLFKAIEPSAFKLYVMEALVKNTFSY